MSPIPGSVPAISAYIPCFNNGKTLASAIAGIRAQAVTVEDFFIVDDGSTDDSRTVANALGVRVVEMKTNQGRGAVRARAMSEARHDLVLCCDATNQLQDRFVADALPRFSDSATVGVIGRIMDLQIQGALGRWRARHLFRQHEVREAYRDNLSTWGTLLRKGPVMEVGNFDARLRFGEDIELGRRLIAAGYSIWFDPALVVATQVQNSLSKTMERFLRWQSDDSRRMTLADFVHAQSLAFKILAPMDLREGDPLAALISLSMPYFKMIHHGHFRKEAAPHSRGEKS